MFQDIFPHVYHNEFSPAPPRESDFVLSFSEKGLLCQVEGEYLRLPTVAEAGSGKVQYLFAIDDRRYYLWDDAPLGAAAPWAYAPTRPLRQCVGDHQLFAMAAGESLWRWYGANRFCGKCGAPMAWGSKERSRVCPQCGHTVYPRICPAVIVAVHDGERLLLSKYRGRVTKQFALIAGYNEIGESIEETVHREVLEEVGLHVKNLRFYKSQPWTFTDTLLMGFWAELDGPDTITLQEDELSQAGWYRREEIPTDYSPISLTGEMIQQFRRGSL